MLRHRPALAPARLGVGLAAVNDPAHQLSHQWNAFTKLQVASSDKTRFLSGGGNRYDYWRVALDEFKDDPVRGQGAGSYQFTYFEERRTTEDIRQPHSLELQTLAELGLVGAGLLAVLVAGVGWGVARVARRTVPGTMGAAVGVGAVGILSAWFVHTSVDWIHLLPGVSPLRSFSRFYPQASAVGHLTGYVGSPSKEEYQAEDKNPLLITPGFKVGKDGLEKMMEPRLRGKPGAQRLEVTAHGKLVRELTTLSDTSGGMLPLTIDIGLHTYAARRLGDESGSIVVLDCTNGDIKPVFRSVSVHGNLLWARSPGPGTRGLSARPGNPAQGELSKSRCCYPSIGGKIEFHTLRTAP